MKKENQKNKLHEQVYFIATPIGNLDDISIRALLILGQVDIIYAEDTRTTKTLLAHHGITTSLKSLHDHNEKGRLPEISKIIDSGKTLAIVSDAGMPVINDPGYPLLQMVIQEARDFTVIPGACAPICGLLLSGFPAHTFKYNGFIPSKKSQIKTALEESLYSNITSIWLLAKKSVSEALLCLTSLDPMRKICLAREITKYHETVYRDTSEELSRRYHNNEIDSRGEWVLVIAPTGKDSDHKKHFDEEKLAKQLVEEIGVRRAASVLSSVCQGTKKEWYSLLIRKS